MQSELLDLQISNSIFCSVIDTFKNKTIWKKVFGNGTLNKLSKLGESDISNISDQKFFNSVQRIVNKFSDTIEDKDAVNFHSIENTILTLTKDFECKDFNDYELLQTRNILMNWLV